MLFILKICHHHDAEWMNCFYPCQHLFRFVPKSTHWLCGVTTFFVLHQNIRKMSDMLFLYDHCSPSWCNLRDVLPGWASVYLYIAICDSLLYGSKFLVHFNVLRPSSINTCLICWVWRKSSIHRIPHAPYLSTSEITEHNLGVPDLCPSYIRLLRAILELALMPLVMRLSECRLFNSGHTAAVLSLSKRLILTVPLFMSGGSLQYIKFVSCIFVSFYYWRLKSVYFTTEPSL